MLGNFDDGIAYLCTLTDISKPGLKPKEVLTKVARHFFEQRTVSFRRQYAAKGASEQIDMLIRIHYDSKARIGSYVVLGNGEQYRVDNVAVGYDSDSRLRYSELTLSRMEEYYDMLELE